LTQSRAEPDRLFFSKYLYYRALVDTHSCQGQKTRSQTSKGLAVSALRARPSSFQKTRMRNAQFVTTRVKSTHERDHVRWGLKWRDSGLLRGSIGRTMLLLCPVGQYMLKGAARSCRRAKHVWATTGAPNVLRPAPVLFACPRTLSLCRLRWTRRSLAHPFPPRSGLRGSLVGHQVLIQYVWLSMLMP
jgi:hypothetical protein